jgi:hypothetical protein
VTARSDLLVGLLIGFLLGFLFWACVVCGLIAAPADAPFPDGIALDAPNDQ